MVDTDITQDTSHQLHSCKQFSLRKLHITAIVIGNCFEFYDFTIYSIMSAIIAKQFFPSRTIIDGLLLSVSVFGVGFIARPLGGILIGAYADRVGRREAMTLTFFMMAMGTGMLALVPPYETIGVAAPALLVISRLIQGFSAGGEMGPATTYLLEQAPSDQRGFYTSWQSASQGIAFLFAGLVGVLLAQVMERQALESWGWRIPFLLGILIAPIGASLRKGLPEAPQGHERRQSVSFMLSDLAQYHRRLLFLAILAIGGGAVTMYTASYMTAYAMTMLNLPANVAMMATLTTGAIMAVFSVFGGWLSDRFNRKLVMIIPRILLVLFSYPAFSIVTDQKNVGSLLIMVAILVALHSINAGVLLGMIPEAFPRRVRSIGLSLSYAVGVTIFGGFAQSVMTWIISITGNIMTPAFCLIVANIVSASAILFMPENRNAALDR